MLSVKIYSGECLIGHADLFASDPPMGVASGELRPTLAYADIQPTVDAITRGRERGNDELKLRAVTEDGVTVPAAGGTYIEDFADDQTEPPWVHVCGIGDDSFQYEDWFGSDPGFLHYYAS